MTIAGALFIAWAIPAMLNWFIFNATFIGQSQADCVSSRAVWLPVVNRIELFTYGMYPESQQWRVDVAFRLAALVIPMLYIKRINKPFMLIYLVILPFAMWMMLKGGNFGLETIFYNQVRWHDADAIFSYFWHGIRFTFRHFISVRSPLKKANYSIG